MKCNLTTVDQFNVLNTVTRDLAAAQDPFPVEENGYFGCKVQSITTTTILDSNCINFTVGSNTGHCLSASSNRRRHIFDRTDMECVLPEILTKNLILVLLSVNT